MVWAKAGTTTLGSAGDDLDITSMTANKFNQFISHCLASSTIDIKATFENDTSSVYAHRWSIDGGAEGTGTSEANMRWMAQLVAHDRMTITYVISISGEEKLVIDFGVTQGTAGASNAPTRLEGVFKYVPSPDSDITRVDFNNDQAGSFDTGSNLSALTGDETEIVTLQDGTIFEETDTNKAYIWSSSSETWTQL